MYHSFVQKSDIVLFHELLQTTCSVNTMMDVVNRIPNIKPVYLSAQQLQEQYGHLPFIRHHFFQSAEPKRTKLTKEQIENQRYFGSDEYKEKRNKERKEREKQRKEERRIQKPDAHTASGGISKKLLGLGALVVGALAISKKGNGGDTEKSVVERPPVVSVSDSAADRRHHRTPGVTAKHSDTPLLDRISRNKGKSVLDRVPDPLKKYKLTATAKELNTLDGWGYWGISVTPIMKMVKDPEVFIEKKIGIIAEWVTLKDVNLATTDSGHNKIAYDYALELNIDHGDKDKLASLLVPAKVDNLRNLNRFESPFKEGLIQTAEKILDKGIWNKFSDNQKAKAASQTKNIPLLKKILEQSNKPYILFDYAIKKRQYGFIKRLKAAKFDMNIQWGGETALGYAARYSDEKMVNTLLKNGATNGKQEVYKQTKLALELAKYIKQYRIQLLSDYSSELISSAFDKLNSKKTNFGLQYGDIYKDIGKNKNIIRVLENYEVDNKTYSEELKQEKADFVSKLMKCMVKAGYNFGKHNQRQQHNHGDFLAGALTNNLITKLTKKTK